MNKEKFLKIFCGLLFLLLFIYNGIIAVDNKYEVHGDAWDYIKLGLCVAKTGKYGQLDSSKKELLTHFDNKSVKNKRYEFLGKTAFRPPVWPLMIAGVFLLVGYNLTYVIILKFLLHLIGIWIFYKTLRILKLSEIIVILGSFLYAINPAWQLYSRVFLSEPITLFLITLWLYFLIQYIIEKKNFLAQAISGGILILAHPYYIFLPFSVWFILFLKNQINFKLFLISSVVCATVISTWVVRNFIVWETNEVILTTSSGAVMAKGWNPDVFLMHTNTKGDLANEELVLESFSTKKEISGLDEVQRMQLYKEATIHFIKDNPQEILPIIGTKIKSAFNPLPETPRPGFLETARVIFQLLSFLSIIYIIFFSRSSLFKSLAIGLVISTLGITILTYSGFRFRMPQSVMEILFIIFVINRFCQNRVGFLDEYMLDSDKPI